MKKIPFAPVPASRPRVVRARNGKSIAYNTEKYQTFKNSVKQYISLTHKEKPLNGAVRVTFNFRMPIPKGTSKKKTAELNGQHHTRKPDTDNLIKSVLDCMNGICFKDDSQVSAIYSTKTYSDEPCIMYRVEAL